MKSMMSDGPAAEPNDNYTTHGPGVTGSENVNATTIRVVNGRGFSVIGKNGM